MQTGTGSGISFNLPSDANVGLQGIMLLGLLGLRSHGSESAFA